MSKEEPAQDTIHSGVFSMDSNFNNHIIDNKKEELYEKENVSAVL